ncbi:MAG: YggS family pyridoxal phosphate-dependent enzyme [Propionibacteriaceae bacterium]
MVTDIASNVAAVHDRIAAACQRADRSPDEVRLLPVSKTMGVDRIRAAYAAGERTFAENKVQEATDKAAELDDLDARWAVIGHLQTNKAKYVARFAHEFHALDSVKVAEALDRRLQLEGRSLDVFVQVNSSGEDSKFGLPPGEVAAFARTLAHYEALRVQGLMTLAIFSADAERVAVCFERMASLRDQLRADDRVVGNYAELSMGMSGDFELAIAHGATVVRVGQAIFGARPKP